MKLNIAPTGLLELMRLKQLGENPAEFSDIVHPSFDATDFYGAQSMAVTREVGVAGNIGAGIASTPSNIPKRYMAASGGIVVGAAAGTYLTMAIGYTFDPGTITNFVLLNSITVAPVVGGVYRVAASFERLILPPTARIFCAINGNAGGADHLPTIEYGYQRLDGLP